jgi:hypothetical protein
MPSELLSLSVSGLSALHARRRGGCQAIKAKDSVAAPAGASEREHTAVRMSRILSDSDRQARLKAECMHTDTQMLYRRYCAAVHSVSFVSCCVCERERRERWRRVQRI